MPRTPILVVAVAILGAATVSAHHSYGAFDQEHPVIIDGDVTRVTFANPHVIITVQATDAEYGRVAEFVSAEALEYLQGRPEGW